MHTPAIPHPPVFLAFICLILMVSNLSCGHETDNDPQATRIKQKHSSTTLNNNSKPEAEAVNSALDASIKTEDTQATEAKAKPSESDRIFLAITDDDPERFRACLEQAANGQGAKYWLEINRKFVDAERGLNPLAFALYHGKTKILLYLQANEMLDYHAMHAFPEDVPGGAKTMLLKGNEVRAVKTYGYYFLPTSAFEVALSLSLLDEKKAVNQPAIAEARRWVDLYLGEAPLSSLALHGKKTAIATRITEVKHSRLDVFGWFPATEVHLELLTRPTLYRSIFVLTKDGKGAYFYQKRPADFPAIGYAAFQGHYTVLQWFLEGLDLSPFGDAEASTSKGHPGIRPLHLAASGGRWMAGLLRYKDTGANQTNRYLESVKLLVKHGDIVDESVVRTADERLQNSL